MRLLGLIIIVLLLRSSTSFNVLSHSKHIHRGINGRVIGRVPSALRLANETEVPVLPSSSPDTGEVGEARDDEEEFERVIKDSKFLERNKHWVVLIDDEEAIRLAVGDFLYDQGYQITACADADAFLDVCFPNDGDDGPETLIPPVPDAIVSDVRMPGSKDGLELLGLIRADERLSRVPVILLTAKGMTADRVAGYRAGANVYLPKPFDPAELLSILDNSIQRRKQMASNQKGGLIDLKQEMSSIKEIMKRNGERVVQKTNVYLTPVEREVLDLLCRGYNNKEIAEERGVNVIGVNRTIQKLYKVSETQTRTELVRWALKTGYISKR
ncbi:Transcriptional regulatory protein WalR [Seminavis robusta]|uniref:Transcriptional regulatory protein WalR n=1 Tax=Seminavis robusta TaxID=568900 RepID=A0A9N8HMB3_9STRA|nr:Transcriptional regulatory protein WalR [Seminavis robusta]|eukprot:Sro1101_g241350.1 Transcriptional regulatory protein WalR (327) ;mRNA; f:1960-2940